MVLTEASVGLLELSENMQTDAGNTSSNTKDIANAAEQLNVTIDGIMNNTSKAKEITEGAVGSVKNGIGNY